MQTEKDSLNHSRTALPEWWGDWKEQQRRALRCISDIQRSFSLSAGEIATIEDVLKVRKLQITPYFAQLIAATKNDAVPLSQHPLWRQVIPSAETGGGASGVQYDGETDNWETPSEMVSPIAQRKYPNRVIIRVTDSCLSYCQFCYQALRTLEIDSAKKSASPSVSWEKTLQYLRNDTTLEEIILSGGEPLLYTDEKLEKLLLSIREAKPTIPLRIHTRALTFNPFRVTDSLVSILRKYAVTAIGVHVTTALELTEEFKRAASKLRSADILLLANTPLLAGVNDTFEELRSLFLSLYNTKIIPYYLYHFMPFSPGLSSFSVSIEKAIDLLNQIDKKISGIAIPKYVLPHSTGKFTVPIQAFKGDGPRFTVNDKGQNVFRFINWRGESCDYVDSSKTVGASPPALAPKPVLPAVLSNPFEGFATINKRFGGTLINAGNNEAIRPLAPWIKDSLEDFYARITEYPDPECLSLRQKLSTYLNIAKSECLVGSGVDDLLALSLRTYVQKHDRVLAAEGTYPTFFYLSQGLQADIRTFPYRNFELCPEIIISETKKHQPKVLYIANPDNPTGTLLSKEKIQFILDEIPKETLVILDEAYADFVESNLLLPVNPKAAHVIRLRSFSKLHGLASLRVGYAIAHEEIVKALQALRIHFGVNAVAQEIAEKTLDEKLLSSARREIVLYRDEFTNFLKSREQAFIPSFTNFVLLPFTHKARADEFFNTALHEGVFLRRPLHSSMSNCVRVSLPPLHQCAQFLFRLDKALKRPTDYFRKELPLNDTHA